MKVVVTAQGSTLDSPVDPRFGRARYFLVVETETGEFTVASGMETNEYYEILMRGILPRNQGEVTDPLPGEDAILIAYIAKRTRGDSTMLPSLQPQIRESVRQQRTRILFDEWQSYLLQSGGFEDRTAIEAPEDEPVEDYEDVDSEDVPADEVQDEESE